ncbi:MAG: PHP domain-containing protein [Vulcanimicrobiaceae bacterium]
MIVDFHSHTRESDGALEPPELVAMMRQRGVEVFAISDHDSLGAYGKFDVPAGMRVVTGVEINTTYRENDVHILGYGMHLDDHVFRAMLTTNRHQREARMGQMVAQLAAAGVTISADRVRAFSSTGGALGRPHVAMALIEAGYATDINDAFARYLHHGGIGYVPSTYVTPHQAMEAIRRAGGIAVLAHPGRLKDRGIMDELAKDGLDGVEVFYPKHDAADVAEFRAFAARYELAMSAGSDFHDLRYHPQGVGREVAPEDIAAFLRLLGVD